MSETATRPPAKPLRRSSPVRSTAKHHLEPNPFEKSFSSGPDSSENVERRKVEGKTNAVSTPPLSTRPGAAYRDRTYSNSKNTSPQQESGSTPKPLLPPVASITSPAGETNAYPWSGSLTSSLRSGPLSPAMLAGPQSSHFDPNSFRTGFTPDLSNFKTGLTPLGGGMSFPPPSPNTAAFLAAMVNNTSGAPSSAATITPNTLAALTNAANAATNGGSMDPSAAGGAPGGALSTHPQNFAGKPTDAHNAFDIAFSRSFPGDRGDGKLAGSKLKAELKGGSSDGSVSQSVSPQMMQKQLEGAAGDQQNAASGLFLLSRAHQEMSKREGANAASTSLYESKPNAAAAKKGAAAGKKDDAAKPNGNKRKKSGSVDDSTSAAGPASTTMNAPPAKAVKTAKGGKKAAAAAAAAAAATDDHAAAMAQGKNSFSSSNGGGSYKSENGDDDDQQWDSDDDGEGKGNMDAKRKNFLERNRQAALKCRQRKKAWLASLQAKVEYLQNDNENLQNTVGALRNENMFLKSQLVQATGGAPLPNMPMGMPMGMPMAPPPHGVDPHHSMGPSQMGIPANMAPHPAYMHPGASGPPMTQGPGGAYAPAHAPHGVPRGPGFPDHMHQRQQAGAGGRPRSEEDVLGGGIKHEREWSSASADGSKNAGASAAGATIKV
uniref:BZIP domain-containing protein n=1 Tax=Kalmanozyma brasiliensis (strain GHG001) TaxID=1365824 RepID=V5EX29_KALBG